VVKRNPHISNAFFTFRPEDAIRIEEIPNKHFSHEAALKVITDFTEEMKNGDRTQGSVTDKDVETTIDDSSENTLLQRINNLPQNAQICYAVLTRYLKDFKLDRVLRLPSVASKRYLTNKVLFDRLHILKHISYNV